MLNGSFDLWVFSHSLFEVVDKDIEEEGEGKREGKKEGRERGGRPREKLLFYRVVRRSGKVLILSRHLSLLLPQSGCHSCTPPSVQESWDVARQRSIMQNGSMNVCDVDVERDYPRESSTFFSCEERRNPPFRP